MNIFKQIEIVKDSCNILYSNRLSKNLSSINNSFSLCYNVEIDLAKYGSDSTVVSTFGRSEKVLNIKSNLEIRLKGEI